MLPRLIPENEPAIVAAFDALRRAGDALERTRRKANCLPKPSAPTSKLRSRLLELFLDWRARAPAAETAAALPFIWPQNLPQPTFEEVKRLARGFALAPQGMGWSEDVDEIAPIHDEKNRARYNSRLECALIPEWWGRPSDASSLMSELSKIGPHATAMLLISVGLLVTSETGHVDFDIDDLLSRPALTHGLPVND